MHTNSYRLRVSIIGLSTRDALVAKSVAALSSNRLHSYSIVDAEGSARPDIYVVDGDNPAAMSELDARGVSAHTPVVVLASASSAFPANYHILTRPFIPSHLLALLDKVAAKNLAAPRPHKMQIGDEQSGGETPLVPAVSPAATLGGAYRALIVDDSPTIRKQIEVILSALGVHSDCVETGEAALDAVANTSYDIIFLDVVMPGMDGYSVCKAIKKHKTFKSIPVVMLTSRSSPFDKVRGSLAGCDTYLTKPVAQDQFSGVVAKYLAPAANVAGLTPQLG